MAHQRKVIRAKVIELLQAGATVAGDRVFASRRVPVWQGELPCILVFTEKEESREFNKSPRILERKCDMMVDLRIEDIDGFKQGASVDDVVDDFCEVVEALLDRKLGGTASDCILKRTVSGIVEDGARSMGFALVTFEVTYSTCTAKKVAIHDFKKANVTIEGQVGLGAEIEAEIELPTEEDP